MAAMIPPLPIAMQAATITCHAFHAPWWHLPVGIFAILTGCAAAFTAFRVEKMRAWEKAVWITGIALLTAGELQMIVWSDADARKESADAECELQKNFQEIETNDQQQFQATMNSVGQVFDKTKQAADTAKEAVDTITGGGGFCYIDLAEEFVRGKHADQVGTMLEVRNTRIIWHVSMRVLDYQAFQRDSAQLSAEDIMSGKILNLDAVNSYLGDGKDGPSPIFNNIGVNKAYSTDKDYLIEFWALNGAWDEEMHSRIVNGKMVKAIRVARLVVPKNWDMAKHTFAPLYERVDTEYPRKNGQVEWVGYDGPKRP